MSGLMEFLWETGLSDNAVYKNASKECYSEVNSLF